MNKSVNSLKMFFFILFQPKASGGLVTHNSANQSNDRVLLPALELCCKHW